ncbi:hypothetical protein [Octadecabacter antarcticus]|uniref:hypothetical protein n=1 Tax=Octadecabacter antarcticus TaxID=1217908 RepID=UPI0005C56DA4|nr:hypothetical protein [Octadecabacter antarcticus]
MANCKRCDVKLGFLNAGDHCYVCGATIARETLVESNRAEGLAVEMEEANASNANNEAKCIYTRIAYVFTAVSFIVICVIALVFFSEGQTILGVSVIISGSFAIVLLGLLAEISSNVAKLVKNSR